MTDTAATADTTDTSQVAGADNVDDQQNDDDTTGTVEDQDDDSEDRGGNSEAAKWRHKTRDAETERDTARSQLTAQREAVLAAAAAAKRVSPALVAKTVEIDELLDDNGVLDPAKAAEAIDEVIKTYGLPDMRPDGSGGKSREGGPKARGTGWGEIALGGARTQW